MKTTLNKIKKYSPCEDGWKDLLKFLNKTEADDEELPLLTILESNGLNHAIWALKAVDGYEKEKRLMACDFAESVIHLMKDERSINAIKVARNYANGIASIEELYAAATAANYATADDRAAAARAAAAAFAATKAAFVAAVTADAASAAAADAAAAAAYHAEAAARADAAEAAEKEKQIEIFKKYL